MFSMMGRISGGSGSSSEHRKERHGSVGKASPSHSSPSPNCQVTERPLIYHTAPLILPARETFPLGLRVACG